MSIIDDGFKIKINNTIRQTFFKQLNNDHLTLITTYLHNIINWIYITFSINDIEQFRNLLFMDNAKDLKGLFLLLLPYISDYDELNKVRTLNEIYTKKSNNVDLTKEQPTYILSNTQYGRCERNPIREIPFDEKHLKQNYELLKLTIQTISHRLYVNWSNVVPLTLETYKNKKIYVDTVSAFTNKQINDFDVEHPNSHLYIGTIYEAIRHYLYDRIVDIKWLLYDYDVDRNLVYDFVTEQTNDTSNIQPLIKILLPNSGAIKRIDLDKCHSNIVWDDLDDSDHTKFREQWIIFVNDEKNYEIVRAIAYAFDNYNRGKETVVAYIPIQRTEEKRKETRNDILKSVKSIPNENAYEFLRMSIGKFKNTIYYQMIFGELKNIANITENVQIGSKQIEVKLTPKNIYNFSKSLCHYTKDFIKLPDKWISFDNKMKDTILGRLNERISRNNWFNIQKNLRKVYNVNMSNIELINDKIYQICMKNISNLVFICLILSGTISEFVTNKIHLDEYKNGFYFLNGKKYNATEMYDSNDIYYDNKNEVKYRKKTYDTFISKLKDMRSSWLTTYAMNWVSQINFFHKYLNNRVILVTGGTGVGKSTQIPKLLLYGLKMIDGKDTGKIICSQPRKRPTNDNAIRISYEMGVSIKMGDGNEDYDSQNYNIQFQFHGAHFPKTKKDISNNDNLKVVEYAPYPILKFVTDKILLNTITNPLYKKVYHDTNYKDILLRYVNRKKYSEPEYGTQSVTGVESKIYEMYVKVNGKIVGTGTGDSKGKGEQNAAKIALIFFKEIRDGNDDSINFSTSNLYDIVIVDESHEHNTNMDMILTLMKRVLYYNNDCKLVIISATMKDDEPIYRRFYRDINDNRKYPLSRFIERRKLDRINVDRRLHISIPKQDTQYKIAENWENTDVKLDEDTKNKKIVDIVAKIISRGDFQDILVFKVGRNEIMKCVELLNKNTPNDVYAIPYYSELPNDIRFFVEKIHERKKELKIDKSKDISDVKNVSELLNGTSSYNHIIIVATNVAEASITINTLTDVIDDGDQKISEYIPEINGNVLRIQKISDNNRLQRKGRVGRTQNGNVHYLYTPSYILGEKNVYKICIDNITANLFSLLKTEKDIPIFDKNNDPNIIGNIDDYSKIGKDKYHHNIDSIIKKQYFIGDEPYKYYGDDTQYDYGNIRYFDKTFLNCYDYDELIDFDGSFYIIHPNELELSRNMLGAIVKRWNHERIIPQILRLKDKFLILKHTDEYIKTDYGAEIEKIMRTIFSIDPNGMEYTIACAFGEFYGCLGDVLKIVTMLQTNTNISLETCPLALHSATSDLLTYRSILNNELINGKMTSNIATFETNKNLLKSFKIGGKNFANIGKYININKLKTHVYSNDDKITLSFIHAFGDNIVKRITGTKYYLSLKYPTKENIKYVRNKNTCVDEINLRKYNLYINMHIHDMDDISDNEVFMIHYIKPELLKHISYQFDIGEYKRYIKSIDQVDYRISVQYENEKKELMKDIMNWFKQDQFGVEIFNNVSVGAQHIIGEMHRKNITDMT